MQEVYIPLTQCWDDIDETVAYLRDVIAQLKVLQGLPVPPTNLYLKVESLGQDDTEIILRSL